MWKMKVNFLYICNTHSTKQTDTHNNIATTTKVVVAITKRGMEFRVSYEELATTKKRSNYTTFTHVGGAHVVQCVYFQLLH